MGVGMLRPPAQSPALGLAAMFSPGTDAYVDMSDMLGAAGQLVDSTLLLDAASVVDTADGDAFEANLETDPPRPFDEGLTSGDEDDAEEAFEALVEVPRDFLVGGSSRDAFIEFRLPWDGLLLFSDLERLLDVAWPAGVGELFTGTLRRSPIVALAIIPRWIRDGPVSLAVDRFSHCHWLADCVIVDHGDHQPPALSSDTGLYTHRDAHRHTEHTV